MSKKQSADIRFAKSQLALAIALHMLAAGNAFAAPAGSNVVGGSGSVEQQGTETIIVQESDRLAIDWQSFDVGANERVEFVQPGQSAVALNRILGNKGSEILGRIDANGHVILVNSRGVVFGEGAVVNAGGLIASGLQIDPEDFMNGDLVFKRIEGTDGTVINSGMISAAAGGNVALLGTHVENRGLISARLGSVILASGKEAVLTFDESGFLGVRVDQAILQDELGATAAVKNSGEIVAENGRVLLSASTTRDVFSQAINWGDQKQARSVAYNEDGSFTLGAGGNLENSGTVDVSSTESAGVVIALAENVTHTGSIHADAVQGQGGLVELHSNTTTLVEEAGVVTANGAAGGDIKLLGKNMGLFDKASVDAVGVNRGGTVLVGGDREGLNPRIRNADFVYVGEQASIDVSATDSGNGGTTIIFAEDTARIFGDVSAKGGEIWGNGGFIETSGKKGFEIIKSPDLSAAKGAAGHWLIDPYDIAISESSNAGISTQNPFTSNGNSARLTVATLRSALNTPGGATVTVRTGSGGNAQQGNITVSSEINLTTNVTSTLNLIAHNNITINANITSGNKSSGRQLNVHLNANTGGGNGSIRFGVNDQGATINSNVRIETGGGNFVVGQITDNAISTASPGAYNVDFSNVTIDVTGPSYDSLGTFDTYFQNRGVAQNDRQYLSGSGRILVNASNDVNLGGANGSGAGSVTMLVRGRERGENSEKIHIIAGRDVLLDSGRVWNYDNNPTENAQGQQAHDGFTTLRLEAGRHIDLNGNITHAFNQTDNRQEQNDRLMLDFSAGENISIDGNILTAGGDFLVREAANVDFSDQTIDTSSRYGAGSVPITASGNVTLGNMPMLTSGSVVRDTDLRTASLTAIAGDQLILNSSLYTKGGDLTLGAAQWNFNNHTLTTSSVSNSRITTEGDITLTTAGNLTLPTIVSTGNLTLASRDEQQTLSVTGSGPRLNGLLTLDLKGGSANLTNVVNNASGNSANVVIASGRDIQLQTPQAIRLGSGELTGNLNLTSGGNIRQIENSHLDVGGNSRFYVDDDDVVLNRTDNLFGGSVWVGGTGGGEVGNVELVAAQNLQLGNSADEMSVTGTLIARVGGNITQAGVLGVTGVTTLSAGGNITLTENNEFTSIGISRAQSAEIHNQKNLQLGTIQNVGPLTLNVTGDLTQTAALNLDELILAVTGITSLTQPANSVGVLAGTVASGEVISTGNLQLGDFTVGDGEGFSLRLSGDGAQLSQLADSTLTTRSATTISAAQVTLDANVELAGMAALTFDNVLSFVLSGDVRGADATDNSVVINGTSGNGTYEIAADASWQGIAFSINGGAGTDSLQGPDLTATWSIGAAEPHKLVTAPGEVSFRGMELLQGGNQDDTFAFATGAVTTLSLSGGDGHDVADYSGITGDITVPLGVSGGLSGIELIRGNNDGTGTTNSTLAAQGDTANAWLIDALNAGAVTPTGGQAMAFEGFNRLLGGGGADHFILRADLQGGGAQIDGGAGNDIFDVEVDFTANLRGGAGADRFNLAAATLGSLFGGDGNDAFVLSEDARVAALDGGDGLNTLIGFDADLAWDIYARPRDDSTVVDVYDDSAVYVAEAANITGVQGGSGDDTFFFFLNNSGVGADGGEGENTADFSAVTGNLNVNLGGLDQLGLSNIAGVVGNYQPMGTGNSTLGIVNAGANRWTLNAPDAGRVQLADGDTITFRNFNNFLGGEGADRFDISASPVGPIDGRGGNDSFYLLAPGISAALFGGNGNDTLIAYQQSANTWELDTGISYLRSAGSQVAFTGMDVLRGAGDFADTFIFVNSVVPQPTIAAGDGEAIDTIDYSRLTGQTIVAPLGGSGLTGFESVIGNGATSTLIGANQASEWTLDENGEGQVSWAGQTTLFSGFGHWVGGSAADRFVLATLTGAPASIRGGGSADILDMAAVNQAVWVGLGMGTGAPLTITEVETITANPLHSNRLSSAANQASWVINARNAGTLAQDGGSAIGFSGFAHLHGLHANTFDLQANGVLVAEVGAGSVQGGDGNSLLKVDGNITHTWALHGAGTGSLVRGESMLLAFAGLTALEGAGGRDDFVLTDPAASIGRIDGGGGTNSLSAAWNDETLLEWRVADGQGELVNHVAQFLRIVELVGQGGADDFQISGNTSLALVDSGAGDDLIHLSNTSRVATVRAGDGSDIIRLSDSASVTDPIDGGAHPAGGGDRLNLADYGSGVIWNAAEKRIGGFTYRNIEQIDAPTGFANTFQAPDSDNTWTISGANSGVLSTGDGQNLIFTAIAQLLGGNLKDTFILAEEGSITGSIDGGGGTNYLQGNDVANQWGVTGQDRGRLEGNGAPSVASFERIQHLLGGNGTDRFEITATGRLTGGIDGRGGADTLISQRASQSWWIADDVVPARLEGGDEVTLVSFTGVETLRGSGSDILRGGDQDREWRLDAPGTGSLDSGAISVAFSGFSDLIGGAGSDSFVVGENGTIAGVIDGGNGVNNILFERQGAVSVTLDMNRQVANAFKVQRVQTIEAAEGFNHNLYGASDNAAGYSWVVKGANQGLVSPDGQSESEIQFINFTNLFGGGRSDSFRIDTDGSLASIDGGGGDDFLDYSAREGDLDITIGGQLGVNFTISSIEGLVGNDDGLGTGTRKAILRASSGANVWTILGGGDPGQDGINDGVFEQAGGDRIVFRNFSYLQGGSGDDHFVLQDQGILTGSISDNGGNNSLDLTATELPLRTVIFATENLPRGRRENELFVQGIQTLYGQGAATTLIGPDVDTSWLINNRNAGELNYLDRKVTFTGFGNVSGGDAADVFSVSSAGAMSGWFSGGDGTARDQINFTSQLPVSVWSAGTAPTESGWHWLNGGFDVVTAPANAQNRFASDSSRAQVWNFSGTNSGTVAEVGASAALSFSGFGRLLGGQGDDEFVFAAGSNLTGLLDGGEGTNSLDLEALTASISVSIGNRENTDLRIDRIQRIAANEDPARNNWLRGADQNNQWKISGANAGELNGSVQFSGFANLRGGAADDQFIFQQLGGLSGQIDGGAHDQGDVVDYGSLINAVLVDLSSAARLLNVEELVGNDNTVLRGPNQNATWRVTASNNQGQLSYGVNQVLDFKGVNRLIGGNSSDEFVFANGAVITGGVDGGDGADRFFVGIGGGSAVSTSLFGGAGEDSLEFLDGGEGWRGTWGPNANSAPQFAFSAPGSNLPFTVGYNGMESILVQANLDRMTLTGRPDADEFRLGPQSWQWGSLTQVSYRSGMRALTVDADSADTIRLTGTIRLSDELLLRGGQLASDGGTLLEAGRLVLEGLQNAGSAESPLNISVNNLVLADNIGALHLREENSLVLDGLTGNTFVDLRLRDGDLNQSGAIVGEGNYRFEAENGAVRLTSEDNLIAGVVGLYAATDAVLTNATATVLSGVRTRNLQVTSSGDLGATGGLVVADMANLVGGANILLNNADNDFARVSITSAGDVSLVESNLLNLTQADIGGGLNLTGAQDIHITGNVKSQADVNVETDGALLMIDAGSIESVFGNISIVSTRGQGLRELRALEGEVFLRSGEGIADFNDAGNAAALNIQAKAFRARAVRGIGVGNALELNVGLVDLVNQDGAVTISNRGPLVVERMRTNGDIALSNSTDVTFMKESVNAFHGTEGEAQYPPENEREKPTYGGKFLLEIEIGNIKTDGSLQLSQPHIAANVVTIFNAHGVFLPPSPVIYAPSEVNITSGRSRNRPYWGLDVVPDDINDDTKYYGDVVGAGEQLIEVESLADIDPAIFTPVKNYVYQDVSIRLPSDQLYEEE